MKKRALIFLAYWFIAVLCVPVDLAWAYIDPATTTYIIQIAAAIVITLGVSLGVFVYKFQMIITNIRVSIHAFVKRLRRKSLEDDDDDVNHASASGENSLIYKTEEEVIAAGVLDCPIPARDNYSGIMGVESVAQRASERAQKEARRKPQTMLERLSFLGTWLWKDERSFKKRAILALIVSAAISVTFIIFGMLDSILQNEAKMNFSFSEIVGSIFIFGIVVFALLSLVLLLLKGRVFNGALSLLLTLLICGYLQSTFLNASVGPLMGEPLTWGDLGLSSVLLNTVLWLVVFALVFYFGFSQKARSKNVFGKIATYAPLLLIAVQVVALLSILPPAQEWSANQSSGTIKTLTTKGMYDVSSQDNVIVFVLDMLDEEFINEILEEDPHYFDDLDGFTRFTNNLSVYNSTFPSVVNMMTGVPFSPNMSSTQFLEESYQHKTYVEAIHDQGYTCNLYMEKMYTYSDGEQLESFANNLEPTTFSINTQEILGLMTRLSMLKSAPLALKAEFSIHPDDFRKLGAAEITGGSEPYLANDPQFYTQLATDGLQVTSDEEHFTYYHLNGSHYPWYMNAQAEATTEETNGPEQTKGSFYILREYFKQMKELGIYDDATIIITGDHPTHLLYKTLDKPMLVGLFVKPAGEQGSALKTSNAPVSLENLRATCVAAAGGDSGEWGRTYFEVPEDELNIRHYYNRFTDGETRTHHVAHYRIEGDARYWENWHLEELIPYDSKYWF